MQNEVNELTQQLKDSKRNQIDLDKELKISNENFELKNEQLRKLTSEFNKCEMDLVKNLQLQREYEDEKMKLTSENRKLNAVSESLKRDMEFLEKEMNELRGDNEALREELEFGNKEGEENKSKDELMDYYKAKLDKYDNIFKQQQEELIVIFSNT